MKIIATADWHLSEYIWNRHRSIEGDSYYALGMCTKKILEISQTDKVVVFVAGDIFDNRTPSPYTEYIFKMNVQALNEAGVEVYTVQGNHDYNGQISRAAVLGAKVLTNECIDGLVFIGLDANVSKEGMRMQLANVPPCDYLVMHAPFQHLLGFENAYQVTLEDIPDHIKNVIVGDIHIANVHLNNGTKISSPGSTHPRNIREIEHKHGFYVIDTETNKYQYEEIEPRRYEIIRVLSEEDILVLAKKDLSGDYPLKEPVIILKTVPSLEEAAVKSAKKKTPLVITRLYRDTDDEEVVDIKDMDIPTLADAVPLFVSEHAEPELFDFMNNLVSGDVNEVLSKKKKEYGLL